MPPTGPEWGFVRVEAREGEEPYYRGRFLPAGATGTQKDKAHCLFCGFVFIAAAHLSRAHVGRTEGGGVKVCTGVTPREEEAELDFKARQKCCQEGESWRRECL